jgi:hypothetical protein
MHNIKSVLNDRIFEFREMKEAFKFILEQKHFLKVVIKVCDK